MRSFNAPLQEDLLLWRRLWISRDMILWDMGFRSLEDSRKFRERKGGRKGRNIMAHIKDDKKMSLMRIQHSHFPLLNR